MSEECSEMEFKDWMDRLEDALFQVMIEAVQARDRAEAEAWAELMVRAGVL